MKIIDGDIWISQFNKNSLLDITHLYGDLHIMSDVTITLDKLEFISGGILIGPRANVKIPLIDFVSKCIFITSDSELEAQRLEHIFGTFAYCHETTLNVPKLKTVHGEPFIQKKL